MMSRRRIGGCVVLGVLAFCQWACTSMVPIGVTDTEALLAAIEAGDRLSVLDSQGVTTALLVTAVGVDFIEGTGEGEQPVRIVAAEIDEVRERKFALGKAIGLGAGVGMLLFMQTASEWGSLEW